MLTENVLPFLVISLSRCLLMLLDAHATHVIIIIVHVFSSSVVEQFLHPRPPLLEICSSREFQLPAFATI